MNVDKHLRDLALLATRLTLGGSIAMHGAQKMFGVQDGPGLKGASGMMESLGFKPGTVFASLNAATEMASGTMIALGVLGPIGPALLLSVMAVATETVHRPKGYWQQNGGFEMNAMYAINAVTLANEGYGAYSLDELLGWRERFRPMHGWLSLTAGIAAAMVVLAQREKKPEAQPQEKTEQHGSSQQQTSSDSLTSAAV